MNYGVRKEEVLRVASHLLDNLLAQGNKPPEGVEYYNRIFTLSSVKNEWATRKQLIVEPIILRPVEPQITSKIVAWQKVPAIRESFVPAFPEQESELQNISAVRQGNILASIMITVPWASSEVKTSI